MHQIHGQHFATSSDFTLMNLVEQLGPNNL